jgi:fucose 4-O-acetylase-like acetyltransferase
MSSKAQPVDAARGLLLLGVLHIHVLHWLVDHLADPGTARLAGLQIKLLTPHVVLFFALSGMTSAALGDKSIAIVVQRSLMLILVAAFSHAIGVLIQYTLWRPWRDGVDPWAEVLRPIVVGTGHVNVIGWFFIVLAVVRVLAFVLSSHWRAFALVLTVVVALIVAGQSLGLPDNLYEWRHWPAALLMFLLGTRLARVQRVPHWIGLPAAAAGLVLPAFNRPGLWAEGLCLRCDPQFVAQPIVGGYGFWPLYAAQEALAVVGLLWLAGLLTQTPLAGALAWVGRRSLQLLVLHGWVILSAYGVIAFIAVPSAGAWLFIAVFAANTLVHVVLYKMFAKPLGLFFSACSASSRRWVTAARAARRRMALSARP